MSETTNDPGMNAKIARLRELITTAVMETVDLPNSEAWLRISMTLATELWVSGTMQYELRPYAWRVRKALKQHVAKHPRLPQAQLHRTAAEIAATVL
jgi:hypothetical protein